MVAWTFEILRHAPGKAIGPLLSTLACITWDQDYSEMENLPKRARPVCGHVFKRGEVIWTCRTCAKDQTCVQCNECFLLSNHIGHETFFHPAGGFGGCCDCGDPEAWSLAGNCTHHNAAFAHTLVDEIEAEAAILAMVPPELQRGLRVVLRAATSFLVSFVVSSVRAFQQVGPYGAPLQTPSCAMCGSDAQPNTLHCQCNPFTAHARSALLNRTPTSSLPHLALTIHNDDVHTYQNVIDALTGVVKTTSGGHISAIMERHTAEATTSKVDDEGQACVFSRTISTEREYTEMQDRMTHLSATCGLLTSLAPLKLYQLEHQMTALLEWIVASGKDNEGFERIASQIMVEHWWQGGAAARAGDSGDPLQHRCLDIDGIVPASQAFQHSIFINPNAPVSEPFIPEGDVTQVTNPNPNPNPNPNRCDVTQATPLGCLLPFPSYLPHHISAVPRFQIGLREDLLSQHVEENVDSGGFVDPARVMCPLLSNSGLQVPLSLFVLASPYLTKSIRQQFNSLVVIYQQDSVFKAAFSQLFTALYPALHALKIRGINIQGEEIFSNSVQIYTANGVVTSMSSDGLSLRAFPEVRPVYISKMLVQVAYNALLYLGCSPTRQGDAAFLGSNAIANRRLVGVFRDTEYVSENHLGNVRILAGLRDPGTVEAFLKLCELLQGLDPMRRRSDTHVEMETDTWCNAANLILELESSTANFLCNALFPSQELLDSEKQVCSVGDGSVDVGVTQAALCVALRKAAEALGSWAGRQRDAFLSSPGLRPTQMAQCLGIPVAIPSRVKLNYSVSKDDVSVHIPLHRFLAKIMLSAACRGLDLKACLMCLVQTLHSSIVLLDYPLRNLAFVGQVNCRLWVRNGFAAHSLAYNYAAVPLCRSLRDMDLVGIQVAVASMGAQGPGVLLAMAILRFGLGGHFALNWFVDHDSFEVADYPLPNEFNSPSSESVVGEDSAPAVAEVLKMLGQVVLNLPPVLQAPDGSAGDSKSLQQALDIAVVNNVLAGTCTMGGLSLIKSLIGNPKGVRDSSIMASVERCCSKRIGSDGKIVLDVAWDRGMLKFYDPLNLHILDKNTHRREDEPTAEKALQLVVLLLERMKAERRGAPQAALGPARFRPLISPAILLPPHPDLDIRPALLGSQLLLRVIRRALELKYTLPSTTNNVGSVVSCSGAILERIVYILTLRELIPSLPVMAAQETPLLALLLKYATIIAKEEEGHVQDQNNKQSAGGLEGPYRQGLLWLVCSIAGRLARAEGTSPGEVEANLRNLGVGELWGLKEAPAESAMETDGGAEGGGMDKSEMARRKAAAMARAKAMMTKQAASFSASEGIMDTSFTAELQEEEEEYDQGPACVICHDLGTAENPIGYLAQVQASSVQSTALLCGMHDPSMSTGLASLRMDYRVVPARGCEVYRVPDLNAGRDNVNIVCHLQQGQHVTAMNAVDALGSESGVLYHPYSKAQSGGASIPISAAPAVTSNPNPNPNPIPFSAAPAVRLGTFLRITSPVDGWVPIYQPYKTVNSQSSSAPPKADVQNSTRSRSDIVVNLTPVSRLLFTQHGPLRHHICTCGHTMHFSCHANVKASLNADPRRGTATQQRDAAERATAQASCVDLAGGEIMCPLCRAGANTLIKRTDKMLARSLLGRDRETKEVGGDAGGAGISKPAPPNPNPPSRGAFFDAAAELLQEPEALPPTPIIPNPSSVDMPRSAELLASLDVPGLKSLLEVCAQKLPWLSDMHARQTTLSLGQSGDICEVLRGAHTICAAVGYTLQSAVHARRWCQQAAELAGSTGGGSAKDSAGDGGGASASSELAPHLVLLLRYLPLLFPHTAMYRDADRGTAHANPFLADFVCPLQRLLAGVDVTDVLQAVGKCCGMQLMDISKVSASDARRVLLTLPFETCPSLSLPDNRRRGKILQICGDKCNTDKLEGALSGGELWAFLMLPLMSQDLVTIACCVVAASGRYLVEEPSTDVRVVRVVRVTSPLGEDALLVLVWAKICQSLMEPAAQIAAAASISGMEASLVAVQMQLGICMSPFSRQSQTSLLSHVAGSLLPYLEFMLLLRTLMRPGEGEGTSAVPAGGASGQDPTLDPTIDPNPNPNPLDPTIDPRLAEAMQQIDLHLHALSCPPLAELLHGAGSAGSPLRDLATRWGRQYWRKIQRTTGIAGVDGDDDEDEDDAMMAARDDAGIDASEARLGELVPPFDSTLLTPNEPALARVGGSLEGAGLAIGEEPLLRMLFDGSENGSDDEWEGEGRVNMWDGEDGEDGEEDEEDEEDEEEEEEWVECPNRGANENQANPAPLDASLLHAVMQLGPQMAAEMGLPMISLPTQARGSWAMTGVDPEYFFIDEPMSSSLDLATMQSSLQCLHSVQPLLGSISGVAQCYGVNGEKCEGAGAGGGEEDGAKPSGCPEAPTTTTSLHFRSHRRRRGGDSDGDMSDLPELVCDDSSVESDGEGGRHSKRTGLPKMMRARQVHDGRIIPCPSIDIPQRPADGEPTAPWPDVSHLSLGLSCPPLLMPPRAFNDLYHRCKFPHRFVGAEAIASVSGCDATLPTEARFSTLDDPAVCLVCGAVVSSAKRNVDAPPSISNPGECTMHSRLCGAGTGMFYLLHKHSVLLMRPDGRAALWTGPGAGALYVDEYGETGPTDRIHSGSSRPLFLSLSSWRRLVDLWVRVEVSREVVRTRFAAQSVIRPFYY